MSFLSKIYKELDFSSGALYSASDNLKTCRKRTDWIEKGEWLSAAKKAGADKVFFVNNNPVAVFSECKDDLAISQIKKFNSAWCMARPRLLFLSTPGELTVYDLAQTPAKAEKDWKNLKRLAVLYDIRKVSEKLQEFHRDNIESGRLFGDKRFGDIKDRADKALIRNLKVVRRELIANGLDEENVRYAHALIGRSIFIRYLEDRGVLTKDYFLRVAKRKSGWTKILSSKINRPGIDFSGHETFYSRILSDKEFTYTLFAKLSQDFNGDIFPDVDKEKKAIKQKHLSLIQDLLYGDAGIQKKLFFYSYQFDIVPVDLISSIYEEFYHSSIHADEKASKARQEGTYYTPPALAEFVLSRALPLNTLKKNPRVMDAACGSGIFLTEAFRRIVRYKTHKQQRPLSFIELKTILKNQIAGIEVNPEAANIAAFSLYLSMLHYLDPPDILKQIQMGNKLPNLVASDKKSLNHFHCILPANAFDTERINSHPVWKESFASGCVDIVVGNPPWGAPGTKADPETKQRHKLLVDWCEKKDKPIGDKEPSQAFIWRALDFLKPGGYAGMLVAAGVFFKHSKTSQAFRKQWINSVQLKEVYNFTHVRNFFFKGACSPFVATFFGKEDQQNQPVCYWLAKQTIATKKTQAVLFSKHDLKILRDSDLTDYKIWKLFWWGGVEDKNLIRHLERNKTFNGFVDRDHSGQGFKVASKDKKANELIKLNQLPVEVFSRYDPLGGFIEPPPRVHRLGILDVYHGDRILVQRGIKEKISPKGQIIARYETEPFCFTHAINGIKLFAAEAWKYKAVLGILWSSLSRYFFFLTSANWGLWHHAIDLDDELLQFPVVLNEEDSATKKIIRIVDKLRNYQPIKQSILHPDGIPESEIEATRHKWEVELDEAVFELYNLDESQIDLIRDLCEVTLPLFYQPFDSMGAMPAIEKEDSSWIENYIHIFCRRWNAYLEDDEEMRAEIHMGANENMVAVEFYPAHKKIPWDLKPKSDSWNSVLEKIGKNMTQPLGTSQIVLDGLVHVVSDAGITIIKRNEKRFWTRSLAREDAESTLCKRMIDTKPKDERAGERIRK